ncbi:hypothetical protein HMPREF1250_2272 [Megasphaera vaginalis (ex Srinivasan et al. 2021)]|uniref:Uncharacterized protein n=1 Tax=Megasphaera vaginalis (ex Srinivasan et al. 2021) TaxID=1111454 RepID=U7UTH1_9FIRM|nr:hypothetical protein HMPREF1250_2272 [Megasphaera vaginalis (ex Srinivasan et al. 2021)]
METGVRGCFYGVEGNHFRPVNEQRITTAFRWKVFSINDIMKIHEGKNGIYLVLTGDELYAANVYAIGIEIYYVF